MIHEEELFEEQLIEGVVVRRSKLYPKLWASADGRIVGSRRHWRNPTACKGYLRVSYVLNGTESYALVSHLVAECWVVNANPEVFVQVHHIDTNKANNDSINLEYVTNRFNCSNKVCHVRKTKSSQYVGVHWCKRALKYVAQIQVDKKAKNLGRFVNEVDAARCYDAELVTLGSAPINFPNQ